jgi:hypothetical protein
VAALPSWRDGPAKRAIFEIVERVRDNGQSAALERAEDAGWTVVSIKNDWLTVFFERQRP